MASYYYGPRPVQTPMRHHGRNWPTNINTPGVHAFQRGPRSIFEEQAVSYTHLTLPTILRV